MLKQLASVLCTATIIAVTSPVLAPPAEAALSPAVMALAGPLAQQFGIPAAGVTKLLEGGLSLESVTQLLLVSQSSDTSLDSVTQKFNAADQDIDKTADQLGVDAKDYSDKKVNKTIKQAKKKAQADAAHQANQAAGAAADSAAEATDTATKGASDAMDEALGGLGR